MVFGFYQITFGRLENGFDKLPLASASGLKECKTKGFSRK
jgi:hypothetical protein